MNVHSLIRQAWRETQEDGKAKCIQTRTGQCVRIYSITGADGEAVHGAIFIDGGWRNNCWADLGPCYGSHPHDLIPTPPKKHVMYFNVYPDAGVELIGSKTRAEADKNAYHKGRVACIRVEAEEGRFDL